MAAEEVDESVVQAYRPVKAPLAAPDSRDVDQAAAALIGADTPVIVAGQGVLYAGATQDVVALAEALQAPVMTTLEGKERVSPRTTHCPWGLARALSQARWSIS